MSGAWWVNESDLKDEQLKILNLDLNENLLILGPPGSGKTNLLLLRANHLHIADQSEFFIVTFTTLLADFIKTGASLYSFPTNKIITQTKLFESVLADHGMLPPRTSGETFEMRQSALNAQMELLIAQGKGKASFPMLFIDEAQDYDQFVLSAFIYLAKNISFSADPRQGIYVGKDKIAWLSEICVEPIRLTYHFRVGRKIVEVADKIMLGKFDHSPMLDTCQYKEDLLPSSVDVHKRLSLDAQIERTAERLELQLKAYPGETLGVLVPRKKVELPIVFEALKKYPALSDKITNAQDQSFDPSMPIWLSTIHSSKGLEFRAVHLIAADEIKNFFEHSRRLAFTAVTRAKTALVIYHNNDLLPFFSAAVSTKNLSKIKLSELFGKTK